MNTFTNEAFFKTSKGVSCKNVNNSSDEFIVFKLSSISAAIKKAASLGNFCKAAHERGLPLCIMAPLKSPKMKNKNKFKQL